MTFEDGEINAYCYMVQRGKPAALLPIKEKDAVGAIALVELLGLKSYQEILADGWVSLWIYKYPHILEVIKSIPQEPKTAIEHWILGKLLGYEEAAIQDFLTTKASENLCRDI
jgi:hypothetical protein